LANPYNYSIPELKQKALEIRRNIITMLVPAKSGHTGGPLSFADVGTALFFHELTYDPRHPKWEGRGKGAASAAKCGVRNLECGIKTEKARMPRAVFRIPHSLFRISPHLTSVIYYVFYT